MVCLKRINDWLGPFCEANVFFRVEILYIRTGPDPHHRDIIAGNSAQANKIPAAIHCL
jgi:hypothetical protein